MGINSSELREPISKVGIPIDSFWPVDGCNLPIYNDPRFYEVFSALGAPRKVVDTVLESATHGERYRLCVIFRNFHHRE